MLRPSSQLVCVCAVMCDCVRSVLVAPVERRQLQVLLMLDARDRGKSTEIEGRKQSERRKKVKRRKRKQVTERK